MTYEISFKTKLPERLLKRLNAYVNYTKKTCAAILLEETQKAVVIARNRAAVKTGLMKSEVRIEEYKPQELYIRAGCYAATPKGVHYPNFVEWGTSRMPARPFWVPAIWEGWYRIMERMRNLEKELTSHV